MEIKKEHLFPTVVYQVTNVLSKESIKNLKQIIIDSHNEDPINKWQSDSTLHEWDEFKDLTKNVMDMGKYVFDNLNFIYDSFEITEMWANVSKTGDEHPVHTHLNNIYSGVFYVKSEELAGIRFLDPRPGANVLCPTMKKYNDENSNICTFPDTENTMLLFPSWLQHFVPPNKSEHRRISISFNLMLRGLVGSKGSLQSAEF